MAILSKFAVFKSFFFCGSFFFKLKLIFFYNRVVYYYTRIIPNFDSAYCILLGDLLVIWLLQRHYQLNLWLVWPAGVEHSRSCWQLHPTEDNINQVIIGMSPCPAGVVLSADVVDSFIRPKIISTKWLPECHHVLQVFFLLADVVDSFIRPKIISTKWSSECLLDLRTWLKSVNGGRYVRL